MNNFVLLVLDSCRYDSFELIWSQLNCFPSLGNLEKAYSFATWTLPSHVDFLAGRLPWKHSDKDPRFTRGGGRLHYEKVGELKKWKSRLDIPENTIISDRYSIHDCLHKNGYKIKAITSASPIGQDTMFSKLVDSHKSIGSKGDCLLRAKEELDFSDLSFYIINLCETHYPYWIPGYDPDLEIKVISGLRGLARAAMENRNIEDVIFSSAEIKYLKERQQKSVSYLDSVLPQLLDKLPFNTSIVITADHGEAFGEGGYVGHGEVSHEIVLTVPFIEVSPNSLNSYLKR